MHVYGDTGMYTVKLRVVDQNGCVDSISNYVIVGPYFKLEIPNAFTPDPNGSGGGRYDPTSPHNRVFFPITEGVEKYNMLIFNRWGELIFKTDTYEIGWDGYYRGKPASQEVYVWKIEIVWENGQYFEGVGDVTLFR